MIAGTMLRVGQAISRTLIASTDLLQGSHPLEMPVAQNMTMIRTQDTALV